MIDSDNIGIYLQEIDPSRLCGFRRMVTYTSQGDIMKGNNRWKRLTSSGCLGKYQEIYTDNKSYKSVDPSTYPAVKYRSVFHGIELSSKVRDILPKSDLDKLQPHEHGILKLRYGLTQEDISIPEVFRQFVGVGEDVY